MAVTRVGISEPLSRISRRRVPMRSGRSAAAVVLGAVCLSVSLYPAASLGVPAPQVRPVATLGFGERYGTADRVHSGVDVTLPPLSPARSAIAGVVTFAGLIPSTGGDSRVGAVSVRGEDGNVVTVSPLRSRMVGRGEFVSLGQPLGEVSLGGDLSSSAEHVHLSERIDGRYVDPTHLLVAWFGTYATPELAEDRVTGPIRVVENAAGEPRRTAAPVRVQVEVAPSAETEQGGHEALRGQSATLVTTPILSSELVAPVPTVALALERESVSHPMSTLRLAGDPVPSTAAAPGSRNVATGHSPFSRGVVATLPRLVSVFRFLGVGLVTLAAGLVFALVRSGGSKESAALHRLGSLFAVRGERW